MPRAAISHAQRVAAKRRPAISRQYDVQRGSAASRGYGHNWRKLAMMVLNRDPICVKQGCNSEATEVDHIVPRRQGGEDSMENLQGLCKACHSHKTRRETS